jgi:hypothetical protein
LRSNPTKELMAGRIDKQIAAEGEVHPGVVQKLGTLSAM